MELRQALRERTMDDRLTHEIKISRSGLAARRYQLAAECMSLGQQYYDIVRPKHDEGDGFEWSEFDTFKHDYRKPIGQLLPGDDLQGAHTMHERVNELTCAHSRSARTRAHTHASCIAALIITLAPHPRHTPRPLLLSDRAAYSRRMCRRCLCRELSDRVDSTAS